MYKVGDKVETPLGVGVIKWIDKASKNEDEGFDTIYVSIKHFPEIEFNERHIKPYRTAHEKLIEMGYEFEQLEGYKIYRHIEKSIIGVYEDKTYCCVEVDLDLSRILTQYLEELEGE